MKEGIEMKEGADMTAGRGTRDGVVRAVREQKAIAIIRGQGSEVCLRLAEAYAQGGLGLVEVTFNQKAPETWKETAAAIAAIRERFAGVLRVGARNSNSLSKRPARRNASSNRYECTDVAITNTRVVLRSPSMLVNNCDTTSLFSPSTSSRFTHISSTLSNTITDTCNADVSANSLARANTSSHHTQHTPNTTQLLRAVLALQRRRTHALCQQVNVRRTRMNSQVDLTHNSTTTLTTRVLPTPWSPHNRIPRNTPTSNERIVSSNLRWYRIDVTIAWKHVSRPGSGQRIEWRLAGRGFSSPVGASLVSTVCNRRVVSTVHMTTDAWGEDL